MQKNKFLILLFTPLLLASCNKNKVESHYINGIFLQEDKVKIFNLKEDSKSYVSMDDWQKYKQFENSSMDSTNSLINRLINSATFYSIPPHEGYNRNWFGFIQDNNYMIFDFLDEYLISSKYFEDSYYFGVYTYINGESYSSSYAVFNDKELYRELINFYKDSSNKTKEDLYYLNGINDPFYYVNKN